MISLDVVSGAHVSRGGEIATLLSSASDGAAPRAHGRGRRRRSSARCPRARSSSPSRSSRARGRASRGLRRHAIRPADGGRWARRSRSSSSTNVPLPMAAGTEGVAARSWQFRDGVAVPGGRAARTSAGAIRPAGRGLGDPRCRSGDRRAGGAQLASRCRSASSTSTRRSSVVPATTGGVFAGDRVVMRGAYALVAGAPGGGGRGRRPPRRPQPLGAAMINLNRIIAGSLRGRRDGRRARPRDRRLRDLRRRCRSPWTCCPTSTARPSP